MATRAAARSLFRSSSPLRSFPLRSSPSRTIPSRLPKSATAQASRFLRSPLEMSSFCVESLIPMHSATASAVMNSLLVASRKGCGWLSEGQDETR